ncbi:MAG TPA: hypothetical protein VFQ92_09385 [Blastocatellia bacterium]|nr:hypothetical protein [Blastocatellia bacterium]
MAGKVTFLSIDKWREYLEYTTGRKLLDFFTRNKCYRSIGRREALYDWDERLQEIELKRWVEKNGELPETAARIIYQSQMMIPGLLTRALRDSHPDVFVLIMVLFVQRASDWELEKPIALSETIMWARSLERLGATELTEEVVLSSLSDLAKSRQDADSIEIPAPPRTYSSDKHTDGDATRLML